MFVEEGFPSGNWQNWEPVFDAVSNFFWCVDFFAPGPGLVAWFLGKGRSFGKGESKDHEEARGGKG